MPHVVSTAYKVVRALLRHRTGIVLRVRYFWGQVACKLNWKQGCRNHNNKIYSKMNVVLREVKLLNSTYLNKHCFCHTWLNTANANSLRLWKNSRTFWNILSIETLPNMSILKRLRTNLKINKLRTLAKLLESNASHAMLFFVTHCIDSTQLAEHCRGDGFESRRNRLNFSAIFKRQLLKLSRKVRGSLQSFVYSDFLAPAVFISKARPRLRLNFNSLWGLIYHIVRV